MWEAGDGVPPFVVHSTCTCTCHDRVVGMGVSFDGAEDNCNKVPAGNEVIEVHAWETQDDGGAW